MDEMKEAVEEKRPNLLEFLPSSLGRWGSMLHREVHALVSDDATHETALFD